MRMTFSFSHPMDVFPSSSFIQPLSSHDSHNDDTFSIMASSLKALLATADNVFNVIETRVSGERARLGALNARLARVREKVGALASSSKALTLYSTPQYPATDIARNSTLQTLHDGLTLPTSEALLLDAALDELAPMSTASLLDKSLLQPDDEVLTSAVKRLDLAKFQARVSWQGTLGASSASGGGGGEGEGSLGTLPSYLPSVTSALLYNSRVLPYKETTTLEDLVTRDEEEGFVEQRSGKGSKGLVATGAKGKKARALAAGNAVARRAAAAATAAAGARAAAAEEERLARLGKAPDTLKQGDALPVLAQVEYVYKPKMRDMAALALPSNLALPNVADIAWREEKASIAPSVVRIAEEEKVLTIMDMGAQPRPPPPAKVISHAPWLPPPPPLNGGGGGGGVTSSFSAAGAPPAPPTSAAAAAAVAPPPPLPPPPPPPPGAGPPRPPPPPPPTSPPPPSSSSSGGGGGGMGDLLAALNTGDSEGAMSRLKKVSNERKEGGGGEGDESGAGEWKGRAERPPPKPAAPKPMSLMDEMAAKMALRNKSMKGEVTKKEGGGIPPPPPPPPKGEPPSSSSSSGSSGALPPPSSLFSSSAPLPPPPLLPSASSAPPPPLTTPNSASSMPPPPSLFPNAASPSGLPPPPSLEGGIRGFKLTTSGSGKKKKERSESDEWGSDSD